MTYEKSRRVVLGHSPSKGFEPHFGKVDSSSSRRMDTLHHDWRDQAVGANVWWRLQDRDLISRSHLQEIIDETECEIIVALGTVIGQLLVDKDMKFFEWEDLHWSYVGGFRRIRVMTIPHPSGLNRFWNDVDNRVRASEALREALQA